MVEDVDWVQDCNEEEELPVTRRKRRRRTNRKSFVGWGSRELIDFLQSIGKDTEEKISRHDLTNIITDYINREKLIDPVKKKNFVSDEKLLPIFGRKSIAQIKIFELLESHYAENGNASDNEGYSSEEREEDQRVNNRPQKDSTSNGKADKRKKASEASKSCFAAIVPENIRAVYLKKTLILELLKNPDSFEGKVLGSFVRVKADRYDYKQKNSHVLQIVTGTKKDGESVRLKIADMGKFVNLSELSDVDFPEEECKDLHRRIQEGLLKKLTVVELQEKVQMLHEDITKHWLPTELTRLECLIDRANEKGWRFECSQYRDKRKLLQTPAEQSRLLQTVPEVIAEELKPDPVPENTEASPEEIITDSVTGFEWVVSNEQPTVSPKAQEPDPPELQPPTEEVILSAVETPLLQAVENNNHSLSSELDNMDQSPDLNQSDLKQQSLNPNDEMNTRVDSSAKQIEVIDLGDSDDDDNDEIITPHTKVPRRILEENIWLYTDPQGEVQGPFNLNQLRSWYLGGYFYTGFTVWKSNQSRDQQVLLSELLRGMFPLIPEAFARTP